MLTITRCEENPILAPISTNSWEAQGAFNGCPIRSGNTYYLLYRAQSRNQKQKNGHSMELSTIALAQGSDGVHFSKKRQIIVPEHSWEKFGCEDPRVTKLGNTFYIFYTSLSTFPFTPAGIKIAMATTKDFKNFEKFPITPFNSKAMALFSEKIQGKYTAVLTANTDISPSQIAIAGAESISDFSTYEYWDNWYADLSKHTLHLLRGHLDHVEVGAPPIKTSNGWLLLYSYIQDYQTTNKIFGVEAVLLDEKNPTKILGKITKPLLEPTEYYERYGQIPNIIFPSGALVEKDTLRIYYGASDTVCALAECSLKDVLKELKKIS